MDDQQQEYHYGAVVMFLLRLNERVSVSFLILIGFASALHAQSDEQAELARMTASQMLGNYQRIRTWQGTAIVVDRVRVGPEIATPQRLGGESCTCLFKSIAEVDFCVDLESDSLFCSYRRADDGEFELPGGKAVVAKDTTFFQESIITPEHFLRCDPNAEEESRLRDQFSALVNEMHTNQVLIRQGTNAGKKFTDGSMVFDPRLTFSFGGRFYWEFPKLYSAWIENGTISITLDRISEPTNGIVFTHTAPDETTKTAVVLDSDSGWLPTKLSTSSSRGDTLLSVQYQESDGIFVPSSYHRLRSDEDGIVAERIVEFRTHLLNEPIAESQFTYSGLGVDNGTRVDDQIRGESLRLLNDQAIPDEEFVTQINEEADRKMRRSRFPLLFANILVVVIACGFVFRNRLRDSSAE